MQVETGATTFRPERAQIRHSDLGFVMQPVGQIAAYVSNLTPMEPHMTNAYVEYRPISSEQKHGVTHHVVIVNEEEVHEAKTQLNAEKWACRKGYTVHVARERHLQHRPDPAHWRIADCRAHAAK